MSGDHDNQNVEEVIRYYNKTESRVGYKLLLSGTKHFGYYSSGDNPWSFKRALRRMEEKLFEYLALPPGSLVLDAGCGVGDVAMTLASQHRLRIVGIDVLDFNLDEARKRARERSLQELVDFRHMSYTDLGFPEGHFDGIYTMETLVHAGDAEQVLGEFFRVLKPGGRLVLFEYSRAPDSQMSSRGVRVLRRINEIAAMPGFQRFEHGVLPKLVDSAGFVQISTEDITDHMLPMVKAFAIIGVIPYSIGILMRRQEKVINAMSAVEFMRYHKHWRYNVIRAAKPR